MDTPPPLQFNDQLEADIKLQIIHSDGVEYHGNPVYLHSHVLKQSKYFEARLCERWSSDMSLLRQINLTVTPNGIAENYMKCIRLMYLSHHGTQLSLCSVDETLDILPVACELLFEKGIETCMRYLEAVPWTPQQKLRVGAQLSSLQVSISPVLAARVEIPESTFRLELELLKKRLPEMLSVMDMRTSSTGVLPRDHMRNTIKKYMVSNFQGNAPPAIQNLCKEALLRECRLRIDLISHKGWDMDIKDRACETLLWFLDLMKVCNREMFEVAFKLFVEDEKLANSLLNAQENLRYTRRLLDIIVERFLKALASGDIITHKSLRISFLTTWVPVMAYLISHLGCCTYGTILGDLHLVYCNTFEEGVTIVLGSIPLDDQKQIFQSFGEACDKFETLERETFQWWINVISVGVTSLNGSHLQIE